MSRDYERKARELVLLARARQAELEYLVDTDEPESEIRRANRGLSISNAKRELRKLVAPLADALEASANALRAEHLATLREAREAVAAAQTHARPAQDVGRSVRALDRLIAEAEREGL